MKQILQKDLDNPYQQRDNLTYQKSLYQKDIQLSQQTFDDNRLLHDGEIIYEYDYRQEESKLISKQLSLPQIMANIISNTAAISDKQRAIIELNNTIMQQKIIFAEAVHTFKTQIDEWKPSYILSTPQAGHVSFVNMLQVNQELQEGQLVCYISPGYSQYYAETYIPQTNFGKVNVGQKVMLRLPSYPYQEYGSVQGRVRFVSKMGGDRG